MLNKLACHGRVFLEIVFLERLFVNPPLWQRWLTSVLPLGYFYLLGKSFALQRWWNHVEREKSLLEQMPTFCDRFCLWQFFLFFFPRSVLLIPLCLCGHVRVWCTPWQTWRKCTPGWWSTSVNIRCSRVSRRKNWYVAPAACYSPA